MHAIQLLLLQSLLLGTLSYRLLSSGGSQRFRVASALQQAGKGNSKQNIPASSLNTGSQSSLNTDVLIVGSGLSGSTAAFYLAQKGCDVILTEANDAVGGNVITKKADGFLWEEGPNSFQPSPVILRLAKDVGLINDLVLADPSLPRFIYWQDQLHALPDKLTNVLDFNLLTWPGKIRALLGALGCVAPRPKREETIEEFSTRHLGAEFFERVVDPFVSGVYAGDPRKLSMSASLKKIEALEDLGCTPGLLIGAITRMIQSMMKTKAATTTAAVSSSDLPSIPRGSLGSFKDGLQSLPLKIQEILGDRIRLSHKLISLHQEDSSGDWVSAFSVQSNKKPVFIRSKAILLTVPAYAAADILANSNSSISGVLLEVAEALRRINYPAVASVNLVYPNDAFRKPLVGFGSLIPRAMRIRTLGTIWSSSLFPGRSPEGYTTLVSFIGGAQDTIIKDFTPQEIVDQAHADAKRIGLLKDDAPLPKVLGVRVWPRAIPQYELGHNDLLYQVAAGLAHCPGLYLGGNYHTGVAIGDCVQYGSDASCEIERFLREGAARKYQ